MDLLTFIVDLCLECHKRVLLWWNDGRKSLKVVWHRLDRNMGNPSFRFVGPVDQTSCLVDPVHLVRSTRPSGMLTGYTQTASIGSVFANPVFFWQPVFSLWFGSLVLWCVWLYKILTLQVLLSSPYGPQVFYFLLVLVYLRLNVKSVMVSLVSRKRARHGDFP